MRKKANGEEWVDTEAPILRKRFDHMPTKKYRDNYDRIFRSKKDRKNDS